MFRRTINRIPVLHGPHEAGRLRSNRSPSARAQPAPPDPNAHAVAATRAGGSGGSEIHRLRNAPARSPGYAPHPPAADRGTSRDGGSCGGTPGTPSRARHIRMRGNARTYRTCSIHACTCMPTDRGRPVPIRISDNRSSSSLSMQIGYHRGRYAVPRPSTRGGRTPVCGEPGACVRRRGRHRCSERSRPATGGAVHEPQRTRTTARARGAAGVSPRR